jgi:hypothetical protein
MWIPSLINVSISKVMNLLVNVSDLFNGFINLAGFIIWSKANSLFLNINSFFPSFLINVFSS